ncbi:hypothetical protein STAL104432_26465 [Streptomyces albus]
MIVPRWMGRVTPAPGKVTVGTSMILPRPTIQTRVRALPRSRAMPEHRLHSGQAGRGATAGKARCAAVTCPPP